MDRARVLRNTLAAYVARDVDMAQFWHPYLSRARFVPRFGFAETLAVAEFRVGDVVVAEDVQLDILLHITAGFDPHLHGETALKHFREFRSPRHVHVNVGVEHGERRVQLREASVVDADYLAAGIQARARPAPVVDGVGNLRGARGLVKVEVVVGGRDVRVVRQGRAPDPPRGQRRPRPHGEKVDVASHPRTRVAEPPLRRLRRRRDALGGHRPHRVERAIHVDSRGAVVVSHRQVDRLGLGPRSIRHQRDLATVDAGVDEQLEHRLGVHGPRLQHQERVGRVGRPAGPGCPVQGEDFSSLDDPRPRSDRKLVNLARDVEVPFALHARVGSERHELDVRRRVPPLRQRLRRLEVHPPAVGKQKAVLSGGRRVARERPVHHPRARLRVAFQRACAVESHLRPGGLVHVAKVPFHEFAPVRKSFAREGSRFVRESLLHVVARGCRVVRVVPVERGGVRAVQLVVHAVLVAMRVPVVE
mmetsp:Transcript_7310/g.32953  ORF Transcript_7310/g.32953 Transcript_7310/m.32953 type:complete len:475 (-) Transcript_7310:607-2031(-)